MRTTLVVSPVCPAVLTQGELSLPALDPPGLQQFQQTEPAVVFPPAALSAVSPPPAAPATLQQFSSPRLPAGSRYRARPAGWTAGAARCSRAGGTLLSLDSRAARAQAAAQASVLARDNSSNRESNCRVGAAGWAAT